MIFKPGTFQGKRSRAAVETDPKAEIITALMAALEIPHPATNPFAQGVD